MRDVDWVSRAAEVIRGAVDDRVTVIVPRAVSCAGFPLALATRLLEVGVLLESMVAMDPKFFRKDDGFEEDLREAEALLPCAVVAKREPKSLEAWLCTVQALVDKRSVVAIVAGSPLDGTASLRLARAFASFRSIKIFLAPGAEAPSGLLSHAANGVVYAPVEAAPFSARDVRDGTRWVTLLTRALGGDVDDEDVAVVKTTTEDQSPELLKTPVVRFAVDQLHMVRVRILAAAVKDREILLDGHRTRIVPSTAARYVDGGYAALHYVKAAPNEVDVCFELDMDGPAGFISVGASSFGERRGWPFAAAERPHTDVANVTRLVVKPRARGLGASRALLSHVGDLFCQVEGLPVRITTRKRDVATKVFRKQACLKEDDATRRQRLVKKAEDALATSSALIPYDESSNNNEFFRTHTPNAAKPRGTRNHAWFFWYVGSPVFFRGNQYTYVGGDIRFTTIQSS